MGFRQLWGNSSQQMVRPAFCIRLQHHKKKEIELTTVQYYTNILCPNPYLEMLNIAYVKMHHITCKLVSDVKQTM